MIVSIIVAVSENNVIGKNNDLIWHLPADMKFFREKTMGHHVLMGRRNFESIPQKYIPLEGRTNIVVTRGLFKNKPDLIYVNDIKSGLEIAQENGEEELFIIGGGEIYRQSMTLTDKLYLTRIHANFDGDTFFPLIDDSIWKEESSVFRKSDDKNPYDMTFFVYSKK